MGILKHGYKYVLITFISIFLGACSNTYWGIIKNNTNQDIEVKLTLINEYGTQVLELLPIKSQDSSIWEYEQSSLVNSKIDKDLSMVEAKNNEGCTITFNRKQINENVEIHRQKIVIETQDFINACGEGSNINKE